ncbi:hypothetical protein D3C86_1901870 [compost metagenome]
MVPVGVVRRVGRAFAVAPREGQREDDHRHDDQQHQAGGDDDQVALPHSHVAGWREQHCLTAGQARQRDYRATSLQ